jgi:hypothetical protein
MADYPPHEIVDMIRIIGETRGNYKAAERLYAERFPDRRHPTRVTIKHVVDRAERGNLKRIREKTGAGEVETMVTVAAIQMDPHTSTRKIQYQHGVPKSTANRILRNYKLHPYHITLTQALKNEDFIRRVRFCNWAENQIIRDPLFFRYMLFSDEATFNKSGGVNRHNCHYYSEGNPHWQRNEELQWQWSINVWAGIVGDYVIGPYFFQGNLNAQNYLIFLQNQLPILLETVDLQTRNRMWFMQDGAPAHRARDVKDYLNNVFGRQWIGLGSQTQEWPPRSPDLTLLDFFLWGYVKEKVYKTEPTTIENMQQRIRNVFRSITPTVLNRVRNNFHNRLRLCIQQGGRVFEHLQ